MRTAAAKRNHVNIVADLNAFVETSDVSLIPYKISTITATGALGVDQVVISTLFELASVSTYLGLSPAGLGEKQVNEQDTTHESNALGEVMFIEFGGKSERQLADSRVAASGTRYRGYSKKVEKARRKRAVWLNSYYATTDRQHSEDLCGGGGGGGDMEQQQPQPPVAKHFENQVTMLVRLSTGQMANCKVFRNGKVQITGLRHIEDGKKFIEFIIAEIKAIAALQEQTGSELQPIVASTSDMQVSQYNVALINTDVRLGFEVKREALYDELRTSCSHLYVTYEPCIYPGVKYLFYWNDMNEHQTGECTCNPLRPNSCKGNGTGSGPRQCKRITIAIFQSGCILVTGGSEYRHIEAAYCYTLKMLASMIHKIKNVVRVDAKLSSLVIEDRYLD